MRLLDRILAEGFQTIDPRLEQSRTMNKLGAAQLVVFDNVAAYYRQEAERKRASPGGAPITADDFPNVMLPFDLAFLDMRHPAGDAMNMGLDEVGILMQMYPADGQKDVILDSLDVSWSNSETREQFVKEDTKWYLVSILFGHSRWERGILHIGTFTVPVNSMGQIVATKATGVPWIANVYLDIPGYEEREGKVELIRFLSELYLLPSFLALSFMHCRNVKMSEEHPPEKLSKKHKKKTGRPLLKYRVLQIDHMKEVLEREGGVSKTGLKRALHICRGHFSHYGQDGKGLLFGKHIATVWVPMHSRGSKKEGVVVKDYDVK